MITLQEYLNNKYPDQQDKESLKELIFSQISEELEGGKLDLREFTNLEKIEIDLNLLKTPLTKVEVNGLTNLKEFDLIETKKESEEDKKLYEELGINQEPEKKKTVQEIKNLTELFSTQNNKQISVNFATQKHPQDKLQGKESLTEEENGKFKLYLNLERKDKTSEFCSSLVLWTLTEELSTIGGGETTKTPGFWKNFSEQQAWVKDNLSEEYRKEFELLLNPSTFPVEKLEAKELLSIYYPNLEDIADSEENKAILSKEVVDKTWKTIRQQILELTSQELSKNPDEEESKKLSIKATIDYNSSQEYNLQVNYSSQNPFKEKIKELTAITPLKLEIEVLQAQKGILEKRVNNLPSEEKFTKLNEEKKELEEKKTSWEEEKQELEQEIVGLRKIVETVDEAGHQKKLTLTEPIGTFRQSEVAIQRLLEKTEKEWREEFKNPNPKTLLGSNLQSPTRRRRAKEVLKLIIAARTDGDYNKLANKWNEGENYNPKGNEFDGTLFELMEYLRTWNHFRKIEQQQINQHEQRQ